jgi:hypothetical protein
VYQWPGLELLQTTTTARALIAHGRERRLSASEPLFR